MTVPKSIRGLVALLAVAFIIILGVIVIGQTAQVVALATAVNPFLGQAVLWALLALYALVLVAPVVIYIRLPRRLMPPEEATGPKHDAYLENLKARLQANPRVQTSIASEADVEAALETLSDAADDVTCETAAAVFISTAISQNGRLDTLLVLGAQTRLIWQLAHIFDQRPSVRDILTLYGNVAATALAAGHIDEIDVSEQLEPVIGSAMGSLSGAIPGFQAASSILVNSTISGAANAFLTLRVGMVTKRYCRSLSRPERGMLRRSATAEAAGLLGGIVARGTGRLAAGVVSASAGRAWGVVEGAGRGVQTAGSATWDAVTFKSWRDGRRKTAENPPETEDEVYREEIEAVIEHELSVETDPERRSYLDRLLGRVRSSS